MRNSTVVLVLLATGCATPRDGWFTCTTDDECPSGWACSAGYCHSSDTADGGSDSGRSDGCVEETFYTDADGDGFGDLSAPVMACDAPADTVTNSMDCDDDCAACHPGEAEVCANADDEDCDGSLINGCPCTSAGECGSGTCCIDGACVANGAPNPVDGCEECASAIADDAWSERPEEAACTTASGAAGWCTGSAGSRACCAGVARIAAALYQSPSGASSTCAVRSDGSLWCWGDNAAAQLGVGDTIRRTVPTRIGTASNWVQVAIGTHTCAVDSDGALWCWGANASGQLGLNDAGERRMPTRVGADSDWAEVAVGFAHTCARKSDASVWCWGANDWGQLGVNDLNSRDVPTVVVGGASWDRIFAGNDASCGIQSDGSMWCWGDNENRQIGLGPTVTTYMIPVPTRDYTNSTAWTDVSLGREDASGVQTGTTGTLWYWGAGNTSTNRFGTDSTWARISLGAYSHTCGVRTDGTLWCWETNRYGQLGIGGTLPDTMFYPDPMQVGSATNWVEVAAGGNHACGRQANGTLWCWGRNDQGELGLGNNGAGTERSVPTRLACFD